MLGETRQRINVSVRPCVQESRVHGREEGQELARRACLELKGVWAKRAMKMV
jgi:hypothetical protein